ncbi:trans-aconitate 2-methyltransferase [Mesorhizobium sp. J428]|uniref:class I SAM-dependent methyltransferase n=1 Tax=Mesorhizobium sp. J428 TaxID=2898440 RepID=UPI0021516657|nr:class I SAM-dependent methyltransferase [Mesorhizobium sp. J428]MCR5858302.1 class I SAM-dependent methyltransferase [Mesorhizobium sp. J428]
MKEVADAGFRARVTHEYGTVRHFVGDRVNFNKQARILDFGCGQGIAISSFALRHPTSLFFGCDIIPAQLEHLREALRTFLQTDIPSNLEISQAPPGTLPPSYADLDLIFAWSVFEHVPFDQLETTMRMLRGRLRPDGLLFIQIDPLYYSPKGSHLYRYDQRPWAHLLDQIDVIHDKVMNSDNPQSRKDREWDQFLTLNRATADDIAEATIGAGFEILAQERMETKLPIPDRLRRIYNEDILRTNEIRLLVAPLPRADAAYG